MVHSTLAHVQYLLLCMAIMLALYGSMYMYVCVCVFKHVCLMTAVTW